MGGGERHGGWAQGFVCFWDGHCIDETMDEI